MILPATTGAALLLCLLIFIALGIWILPWRLRARSLRFEVFSIDFAIGAFALAVVAAFTLGSMGSELAFTDSLLVSGHRAQAAVLAAGLITGIGNVALIASASLGGVTLSFPVAGAVGAALFAWFSGARQPLHLTAGTILALCTLLLVVTVSAMRRSVPPAPRSKTATKAPPASDPGIRSLALAVVSGIAFAGSAVLARYGTSGELGVAPYAAFVFIALPALLSTVATVFFLFNFPLQGARLHASAYLSLRIVQHLISGLAGVIWGAGILSCFLLRGVAGSEVPDRNIAVYAALGSFGLAAAWGLLLVAEPLRVHRRWMIAAIGVFVFSVYFLGSAITS